MKFSIAGYYGFGNVGDEAILESMVADFREHFPGAAFEIIGAEYCPTFSGPDVTLVAWTDWNGVLDSLSRCDWLIVGGGGLFNSYLQYSKDCYLRQSQNFAAFIFGLPAAAYAMGKRSFVYGVGASRFYSSDALSHARLAAKLADGCTVRDQGSRKILFNRVLDQVRVRVYPDPAFRLKNGPLPQEELAAAGVAENEAVVGVVLRNWTFAGDARVWEDELSRILGEFASLHGTRLLFLPFQATSDVNSDMSNDPALIARMRDRLGRDRTAELRHGLTPGAVSAVIGRCEMVVAMRLHGAILSIRNGTPFLALAYDPKIENVLSACGLERFVEPMPAGAAATASFSRRLEDVWSERSAIRKQLTETARRLSSDAAGHVERLKAAVHRPVKKRALDETTAAFFVSVAGEQTRRLAAAEAEGAQAANEAATFRNGVRELVQDGQLEGALQLARVWRPRDQEGAAEREYTLAYCLHVLERDLQEALEHYGAAIQLGFDEFWVLYHRGQLLLRLGETGLALQDLERAHSVAPDRNREVVTGLIEEWSVR